MAKTAAAKSAPAVSAAVRRKQEPIEREARAVLNSIIGQISRIESKRVSDARAGRPAGDPAWKRESFRKLALAAIVGVGCSAGGVPVPADVALED